MCMIVDLPAPFGPSRPVTPGSMDMVMSLTATTLPYQRDTLRSSMRHDWLTFRYLAARPPRQAASKTTARTP